VKQHVGRKGRKIRKRKYFLGNFYKLGSRDGFILLRKAFFERPSESGSAGQLPQSSQIKTRLSDRERLLYVEQVLRPAARTTPQADMADPPSKAKRRSMSSRLPVSSSQRRSSSRAGVSL
jgi:hypothetical protein